MRGQRKRVADYLLAGNSITSLEAFQKFGATRLSAIIYDLKNTYAMNIASEIVEVKNRYGDTCRVAEYRLIKKGEL